jgi:hypothetical protein
MKNLYIIPMLCLFVLSACKKNEEIYSCNPEVNKKATIHKMRNQSISRYELSHLSDLEYQMAVFISLSPENKIRIFKEKIHAELQNTYLSLAEKEILQELITYISLHIIPIERMSFNSMRMRKNNYFAPTTVGMMVRCMCLPIHGSLHLKLMKYWANPEPADRQ